MQHLLLNILYEMLQVKDHFSLHCYAQQKTVIFGASLIPCIPSSECPLSAYTFPLGKEEECEILHLYKVKRINKNAVINLEETVALTEHPQIDCFCRLMTLQKHYDGNHCLNTYHLRTICSRAVNKTKEITRKKIDVAENVHLTFNQANSVLFKYMYTKTYHTANPLTKQLQLIFKG